MRVLVTGSEGFVGKYLRQELVENGYEVTGVDIKPGCESRCLDLLDSGSVDSLIAGEEPGMIIHLAGQADVAASWRMPKETMEINTIPAINILEAVRKHSPLTKVVFVGSSDQYGKLGSLGSDVTEDIRLSPGTPYGVSKKAQEEIAKVYAETYGIRVCMTRSFNHTGAGQRTGFMIPDFAEGIAAVESGCAKVMKVGNLDAKRDFSHVKDVVRAYRMIGENGIPGTVYNVGSGKSYRAGEILRKMLKMSRCDIHVVQDPLRLRPSDTPEICCNHSLLTKDTGWMPQIDIDTIVEEVLNDYRKKEKLI